MTASGKDSSVSPFSRISIHHTSGRVIPKHTVSRILSSRRSRLSSSPCVTKARCLCLKDGFRPGLDCNLPRCLFLSHSNSWRMWLIGHGLWKERMIEWLFLCYDLFVLVFWSNGWTVGRVYAYVYYLCTTLVVVYHARIYAWFVCSIPSRCTNGKYVNRTWR